MDDYWSIERTDPRFPRSLLSRRWPPELHLRGRACPKDKVVAIVGARAASKQAMEMARQLAQVAVECGATVVSGGALGVDAAAHWGALDGGGHTVAVLGCGVDDIYPKRNQRLFEAILSGGGGLMSPFALKTPPKGWQFVRRNQIIAALASVVVVVEARLGSGSLHTARFAVDCDRQVAACAGSPGCEALLVRGASLVQKPSDLQQLLHGQGVPRSVNLPPAESCEFQLLAVMGNEPMNLAQLQQETQLSLRDTTRGLLKLELASLVIAMPGHRYVRSPLAKK